MSGRHLKCSDNSSLFPPINFTCKVYGKTHGTLGTQSIRDTCLLEMSNTSFNHSGCPQHHLLKINIDGKLFDGTEIKETFLHSQQNNGVRTLGFHTTCNKKSHFVHILEKTKTWFRSKTVLRNAAFTAANQL